MVYRHSAANKVPGYDDESRTEVGEEQEVRTTFIASAAIRLSVRCERARNRVRQIRAGCKATDHVEGKRSESLLWEVRTNRLA